MNLANADIDNLPDLDRVNQGLSLPVMELFYTIQGEGANTGSPAIFLRLAGCDVGCHWCDVKESWKATDHQVYSIEDIVVQLKEFDCKNIVVTGGEPLMYNLNPLTKALKQEGFQLWIETSGAHPLTGVWHWICLSPKKNKEPLAEVLDKADELKCIVFNQSDYQFAEKYASQVNEKCDLYLQVEWGVRNKRLPGLIDYVKANPKWKISTQTHKYMDIP